MFSVVVISANCEDASCIPPISTLQVATTTKTTTKTAAAVGTTTATTTT